MLKKIIITSIIIITITLTMPFYKKSIPFIKFDEYEDIFSIGIYQLNYQNSSFTISPYKNIKNPILVAKDLKKEEAIYLADPFIIKNNDKFHLFFEIKWPKKTNIGLAVSKDCETWQYEGVIIDEPFGLSYPYVFKFNDNFYMLPEANQTRSVRLYKAESFPYKWNFVKEIIKGKNFVDPSLLYFNNNFWIFVGEKSNRILRLYYSKNLEGPWLEHPKSPIVKNNPNKARPGGNFINVNGAIFRVAQDDFPSYGNDLKIFRIITLNEFQYEEQEVKEGSLLKTYKSAWNSDGMHTLSTQKIDNDTWLACVDGKSIIKPPFLYLFNLKFKLPIPVAYFLKSLRYKTPFL